MTWFGRATVLLLLTAPALSFADKTPAPGQAEPMTPATRIKVIRSINAEMVYAHTPFPMGSKGLTLKNGVVTPSGPDLQRLLVTYGPSVKAGEQARITDVQIRDHSLHLEINGGPRHRKKWWQHLEVGMGSSGATVPLDRTDPNANNARGSCVDLVFDKYVPEMSVDQLKQLLRPVLDFDSHSAVEAFVDTLPPKVREAVKNHQVLVGMNREMVTTSLGRPPKKIRETEGDIQYEEWIYGEPPQDVQFVRFIGEEVVRLEVMKVDGQKILRTEKEVDLPAPALAKAEGVPGDSDSQKPRKPAKPPSLRRPGEEEPPIDQVGAEPSRPVHPDRGPQMPPGPGDTSPQDSGPVPEAPAPTTLPLPPTPHLIPSK